MPAHGSLKRRTTASILIGLISSMSQKSKRKQKAEWKKAGWLAGWMDIGRKGGRNKWMEGRMNE
eukprot:scaffold677062_cov71-Prasinocladus_malaysianus.AAC.1